MNETQEKIIPTALKSVTSIWCPKMKRDAGMNAVVFLSKKTAFTPASLFIFGRPTDVMALGYFFHVFLSLISTFENISWVCELKNFLDPLCMVWTSTWIPFAEISSYSGPYGPHLLRCGKRCQTDRWQTKRAESCTMVEKVINYFEFIKLYCSQL